MEQKVKGERSSQIHSTFYCLEIKSNHTVRTTTKNASKILIFRSVIVLQSWPFEPRSKNAKLGEMESVSPDDVIWGKCPFQVLIDECTRRRMAAIKISHQLEDRSYRCNLM